MKSPLAVGAWCFIGIIVAVLIVWPALAMFFFEASASRASAQIVTIVVEDTTTMGLFFTSVGWAAACATVATLLAWPVGRAVGRALASPMGGRMHAGRIAIVVLLAAIVLPPWLVYYALWSQCGPGTVLGDYAATHQAVGTLRIALLAIALVLWGFAPASAIVAMTYASGEPRAVMLESLDGWSHTRRLRAALRRDATALLTAMLLISMVLLSETVAFDLAQVVTYGFELRTLDATGAPPMEVCRRAIPAVLLAIVGAFCSVRLVASLANPNALQRVRSHESPRAWRTIAMCAAVLVTAIPACLVLWNGASLLDVARFSRMHGNQAIAMVAVAIASGLLGAALAAAASITVRTTRNCVLFTSIAVSALIALATSPATIVALLLEAAFNRPTLGFGIGSALIGVYDSAGIVVLGLVARTGGWAMLVGMLVGLATSGRGLMLGSLDGPSVLATWRASRRTIAIAASIGGTVACAGSLAELGTTSRLAPPSFDSLATSILNAIHYQRQETVMLAVVFLAGGALLFGIIGLWVWGRCSAFRNATRAASCALCFVLFASCGSSQSEDAPMPLAVVHSIGCAGRGAGQFVFPRVLASDPNSGDFYVIDKDARVQRFNEAGELLSQWRMPEWTTGKPTGASVAPDGSVIVADTHYYRIVAFSPDGIERWRFGTYGLEEGSFIYPTDIACTADGEFFVSEYGSNDRIQVFDAQKKFVRAFGSFGNDAGQFARPQSIAWSESRQELYVADSVNGRVQVFTREGRLLRVLADGVLEYPYGLDLLDDGTLILSELGAHRVRRIDAITGESLGLAGARGFDAGFLQYPWSIAVRRDGNVAVLDSGNNRVQIVEVP